MTEAAAVVNINITTDNTVQVSTSTAMTSNSVKDAIDDSVKVSTTITAPTDSATTEEAIAVGANDLHAATSHDTSAASSPSVRSSDMCPSNADATGEFTRDNCNHMLDLPMKDNHLPRVTPCSLHPSYWSKQRIRVTTIGCLTSAIVCIIRLVVNHESTAYIIHSFIVFFDLILIHIFTYTPWLSIAGESTAIVFATTYYFTHERIFELLETTLIAVFVSMHMIQSRDEHWGREEGLRERVIGLQLHIEQFLVQHDVSSQLRRFSSVSMTEEHDDAKSDPAVEEVDIEVGGQDVHKVHLDVLSSINSTINTSEVDVRRQNRLQVKQEDVELGKESRRVWCKIAFDHFLDGSAGVLYTSFFGLILDEIVTFGTDKYQK